MTSLEDRLRHAFREEAGEIPPGPVPPLRLPGSAGASFLSPTEAVREKKRRRSPGVGGWRRWLRQWWWPP